jgi:hypothetical protein
MRIHSAGANIQPSYQRPHRSLRITFMKDHAVKGIECVKPRLPVKHLNGVLITGFPPSANSSRCKINILTNGVAHVLGR